MNEVVIIAQEEIEKLLSNLNNEVHIKTADIRKLSAKLYKSLPNKSKEHVFSICEELLEQYTWEMAVIAYDWAYRKKDVYTESTFEVFEKWLERYVRGWGDCDDFCTHAFGELICRKPQLFDRIYNWTKREEFWMRRAAAVILIPAIHQKCYKQLDVFAISDALMLDEHYLVQKGYGWMLKIMSLKEPDMVFNYLMRNHEPMPRVAFRYALEKLDKDKKVILMKR